MEEDALESPSKNAPVDTYMLGLSLSHDQLINIIHLSSNWANAGSKDKILIMRKFSKGQQGVEKCKWSSMFGGVEILAQILSDDVFRCHTICKAPYQLCTMDPTFAWPPSAPHFDPEPHKWIDKLVK